MNHTPEKVQHTLNDTESSLLNQVKGDFKSNPTIKKDLGGIQYYLYNNYKVKEIVEILKALDMHHTGLNKKQAMHRLSVRFYMESTRGIMNKKSKHSLDTLGTLSNISKSSDNLNSKYDSSKNETQDFERNVQFIKNATLEAGHLGDKVTLINQLYTINVQDLHYIVLTIVPRKYTRFLSTKTRIISYYIKFVTKGVFQ